MADMPMADDILTLLSELERRYDGPVPAQLRRQALTGGAHELAELETRAARALCNQMARASMARASACRRRREMQAAEAAAADLPFYRSAGLAQLG